MAAVKIIGKVLGWIVLSVVGLVVATLLTVVLLVRPPDKTFSTPPLFTVVLTPVP